MIHVIFECIRLSTSPKILWILLQLWPQYRNYISFFPHCSLFHAEQSTLLNNINEIISTILNKSESLVTHILLYGTKSIKDKVYLLILNAKIDFVLSTDRFVEPLHVLWIHWCFSFYLLLYGYNFTIYNFFNSNFYV